MSFLSNSGREAPDRYRSYVEQFHELFNRHSVGFGKSSNFNQLAPKLARDDNFRVDFSMLARWVQQREDGHLTLNQMLTIVGIATAGPNAANLKGSSAAPVMVLLSSLGGWSETEMQHETTTSAAPVVSAPAVSAPVASAPVVSEPVIWEPVIREPVISAPVAPVMSAPETVMSLGAATKG